MSSDLPSETKPFPPYVIERPSHSTLIVRMLSTPYKGRNLPVASFTFRVGEPQYELWEQRFFEQQRLMQMED